MRAAESVGTGLRAYPVYKDSGVPWIGQIPEGWEVQPVRRGFEVIGGTTPESGNETFWDGDQLWATPEDISKIEGKTLGDTRRKITQAAVDQTTLTKVQKGAILLTTRAPIGNLALTAEPMTFNQGCKALIPRAHLEANFGYYALKAATPVLQAFGKGTTFMELSGGALKAFSVPVPPLHDQQAIIAFLDRETTRIDDLLLEQEGLLEDLKVRRQTLSSAAVTGTLVPQKTAMRTVENIGSIPEHWEVWKLKRLADVRSGVTKGRDFKGQAVREVPYLRVANVQDGYLDLEDVATILIGADELERYALQPGDVLMNEGGDNDKLGRGAVWRGEVSPCVHQNHVFSVRPHAVESEWLALINSSDYAKFFFFVNSKQSTNLASISSSTIKELPVVVPPKNERLEILTEVEKQHTQLDQLVSEVRASMELMRQHRSALITAAVTGKIDVRPK